MKGENSAPDRKLFEQIRLLYPRKGENDARRELYVFDKTKYNAIDRLRIMSALDALRSYKTYVRVIIDNEIRTLALCDTGNSAWTSISKELYHALELGPNDLEPIQGRDSIGTAKEGSRMSILGRTREEFEISLHPDLPPMKTRLVVVPDLGMPMNISGLDLEKYKIAIVAGRHLLYKGKQIPLVTRNDISPEISKCDAPSVCFVPAESRSKAVFTARTVALAPLEEVQVQVVIPSRSRSEQTIQFHSSPRFERRFRLQPCQDVLLQSEPTANGTATKTIITLFNPTPSPVTVPLGTRCGEARRMNEQGLTRKEKRAINALSLGKNTIDRSPCSHDDSEATSRPGGDEKAEKAYSIPPSPDKQSDPMGGDDVNVPDWMKGPTVKANWDQRFHYLAELFNVSKNENLKNPSEKERFLALLLSHWELFAWDGSYGKTSLVYHYIKTPPGGKPVNDRYRAPNPVLSASLKAQIEKWLRLGVIEPSDSAWNSNLLAVVKSSNKSSVRWCVDYRKLNSVTEIDKFPIGSIEDNLSRLGKSRLFSSLDNSGAFHAIEIAPEDKHKTSFASPFNTWQFTRLPFGLSGGPSSYARLILQVLKNIPPEKAVAYVDDILIHSESFTAHLHNLDLVFKAYERAGLKLNPRKCNFLQTEVDYLGHSVSSAGIKPQKDYLKVIESWPVPSSRHEVAVFVGKMSYYRKYVKNFAKLARPLTDLLKVPEALKKAAGIQGRPPGGKPGTNTGKTKTAQEKIILSKSQRKKILDLPIVLTPEQLESFRILKKCLCSPPILGHPRFDNLEAEPFILDTDWCSETGTVGGTLSQKQIMPDGKAVERVIGYASKKLNKSQANYSSTKGEICAILLMIQVFRYFLLVGKFLIRTDNIGAKALEHNLTDPTGYLSRWKCRLAQYQFQTIHRAGSRHGNADSLSRVTHAEPVKPSEDVFDEATDRQYLFAMSPVNKRERKVASAHPVKVAKVSKAEERLTGAIQEESGRPSTREGGWTPGYIRDIQEEDSELSVLRTWVRAGVQPDPIIRSRATRNQKSFLNVFSDLFLDKNDVLRIKFHRSPPDEEFAVRSHNLIILPTNAMIDMIKLLHSKVGHSGIQATSEAALSNVYSFDMRDVVEYVCNTCLICQQKAGKPKKNTYHLEIPRQGFPFQTLNLDFVGPLPRSTNGNTFLLTVMDSFTRWLEAIPLKRATGAAVVRALTTKIFPRFGWPTYVKVDRGSHFLNEEVRDLARRAGFRLLTSPAYHPSSNMIERSHRTLKNILKAMILELSSGNTSLWEEHLENALFIFRNHRNHRSGKSPFELLFQFRPQTELQLILGTAPDRVNYENKRSYAHAHAHHVQRAYQYANEHMDGELARQRKYYYSDPKNMFHVGQRVWLLTPIMTPGQRKTFRSPYTGPWTITKAINDVTFEIAPHPLWSRRKSEVVTAERLKAYLCPEGEGERVEETHPPMINQDLSIPTDMFLERLPFTGKQQLDSDDDSDVEELVYDGQEIEDQVARDGSRAADLPIRAADGAGHDGGDPVNDDSDPDVLRDGGQELGDGDDEQLGPEPAVDNGLWRDGDAGRWIPHDPAPGLPPQDRRQRHRAPRRLHLAEEPEPELRPADADQGISQRLRAARSDGKLRVRWGIPLVDVHDVSRQKRKGGVARAGQVHPALEQLPHQRQRGDDQNDFDSPHRDFGDGGQPPLRAADGQAPRQRGPRPQHSNDDARRPHGRHDQIVHSSPARVRDPSAEARDAPRDHQPDVAPRPKEQATVRRGRTSNRPQEQKAQAQRTLPGRQAVARSRYFNPSNRRGSVDDSQLNSLDKQASKEEVDITDQSAVLSERQRYARKNDSRSLHQKMVVNNIERLKRRIASLSQSADSIHANKRTALRNLTLLARRRN